MLSLGVCARGFKGSKFIGMEGGVVGWEGSPGMLQTQYVIQPNRTTLMRATVGYKHLAQTPPVHLFTA